MPSTMSSNTPSPLLLTILLAMKPAISPRMIHPMIDIAYPFHKAVVVRAYVKRRARVVESQDFLARCRAIQMQQSVAGSLFHALSNRLNSLTPFFTDDWALTEIAARPAQARRPERRRPRKASSSSPPPPFLSGCRGLFAGL